MNIGNEQGKAAWLREYDCPQCGMCETQAGWDLDYCFGSPPQQLCCLCKIPMDLVRQVP